MPRLEKRPLWIEPGSPAVFPDPTGYDEDGLIAGGGDLTPERLVAAYRAGLFPWYNEEPILWWCPDPRAHFPLNDIHASRSLKRSLKTRGYRLTTNQDLRGVLDGCSERSEGTWITDEMKQAYLALGERGQVRSYEVWRGAALVGGLYGVSLGGLFAAESKFHRQTDASKLALVAAGLHLGAAGFQLFDVQFETEHLASLGVVELPRAQYLARLRSALQVVPVFPEEAKEQDLLPWVAGQLSVVIASTPDG